MNKIAIPAAMTAVTLASAAGAEVPSVAADIPPVHSLVAIVMEGLGTPDLIVQPGASPHGYSLRPSEAESLQEAGAVFWVGEELEPWLVDPLSTLATGAKSVELLETEGTTELEFREGATFEAHDHDHGDHDGHNGHDEESEGDDHDHDHGEAAEGEDHDEHDGEEHEGEEHAEDHDHDEHEHHHHGHDPHAWLDPENARVWLSVIAEELSTLDPENAETYRANAEAGRAEISELIEEIGADLEAVRGANFVVFHDAYQYFENRFDFPAAGAISLGDASDPSPARIEEIQHKVDELQISCAFAEPQFNPGLLKTVFQDVDAKTGILDPLGADLTPGPDLYPQLLDQLADSLTDCLS
ncbi:zinc ABC transporter substrate-binding protein [Pseudoruegeria sp. HB172150]|uniref:zinc ABC transporter substrate-binding protein n=1 Tax=Pseudoruegeria sp. HB172150 TaxID=2721164 RepID=UPI0015576568|nr:zinc ABC transporter substrate-binding protein [Pseudoruegeria sp. HB172150]